MADTYPLPSLKDIPQQLVDDTIALISTRLTEVAPEVDFTKQASYRLLPYLHGLVLAGTTSELYNQLEDQNLAGLQAGTLTDQQADLVAKTFGITRQPAVANTISVLFVMTSLVPFSFSVNDTVSIGGLSFSVTSSVSVKTSRSLVTGLNDYALTQIGTGKWGVVLPMTANQTGAASNLAVGTKLSASRSITGLQDITVVASSGIGADQESTASMASRVLAAISIKTWAGRSSFEAIARQDSQYSSLVAMSVVGFGDAEQRRDQRGVLPVSHGGRTDVWCRFRPGLYSAGQTVTAVLTAKTGSIGTWSFTLNGADTPGIFRVSHVVASDDQSGATFVPDLEVPQLGVPVGVVIPRQQGERYVPDVRSSLEAAYSAYQNLVVTFSDDRYDVTSVTIGTTRQYVVYSYYEPLIENFQQLLGQLSTSNPAGDVLVRAAIPCELMIGLKATPYSGKTLPSLDTIRQAVVDYINQTGFVGSISEADIAAAANAAVGQNGTVAVTSLAGQLKRISGSYLSVLPQDGSISIPNNPTESLSGKTAVFYTDMTKVSVVTA